MMSRFDELKYHLLSDNRITPNEVNLIAQYLTSDGKLDIEDLKFLIDLQVSASEVCKEFDEVFFPVLKRVILDDGVVGSDEQFYLLKMLYSDGHIRPVEKQFLQELRDELDEVSEDFEELYQTALSMPERNWDVGGTTHHMPAKQR